MTDLELASILRLDPDNKACLYAANRIEALRGALGSMLESYGMAVGEVAGVPTPLPPLAVDAVKGFFKDAGRCNDVYHAD